MRKSLGIGRLPVQLPLGLLALAVLTAVAALPLAGLEGVEKLPDLTPRRLVLSFDGTANSTYDQMRRSDGRNVLKPSNVLKLSRALLPASPADGREQVTYYATGVGSLAEFDGMSNHLLHAADGFLGGAFGAGFEANMEDALNFLVLNLRPGDEIFIFGFSRGAATAQAVTRFLDWSRGLPVRNDAYYLPVLFRAYLAARGAKNRDQVLDEINAERAKEGKNGLPPLAPFQPVNVAYLGVWDTVMSLGGRFQATGGATSKVSRSFHVAPQPAQCVRHARQALSIDEARFDFRPEIWTSAHDGQRLEQRWFAGVHSNCGGGYANDGLANVALHWVIAGAEGHGLAVDHGFLGHYRPYPQDWLYSSQSLLYKVLDFLRGRTGRGKRALVGRPESAHLELDPSVIQRLLADPKAVNPEGRLKYPNLQLAYRPANVLQFLACQTDLDGYLAGLGLKPDERKLPDDVRQEIAGMKAGCPPLNDPARSPAR